MSQKIPADTHPKFVSIGRKTVSAAIVSAILFSSAHAAGLGKLTVLSSLGQPLVAEIELTSVSKEEAGSLVVKLASVEAFRQASIELNPALLALQFSIQKRGSGQFIRVTSTQPMNEPFIDMLLEVGGANSRLVREYTFLLDPADLRRSQPIQVAAPIVRTPSATPAPQSAAQPEPQASASQAAQSPSQTNEKAIADNKPQSPAQARRTTTAARDNAGNRAGSDSYQVKRGDTLAKIAGELKPEGISLDQMLVALQRSNPDAFIGNNINRLRAGQILSVPSPEAARGISNTEARGVVVAQAADFNAYRNKLAGQVAGAAPQDSAGSRQSATGKITSKVEEQANAANESKDKLKLSKSAAATGSDKGAAAGTEDRIAREKALADANARVRELEKNVSDLQKILEVKNRELAERQKQADSAKTGINSTVATAAPATASKPIVGQPPGSTATPAAAVEPTAPAAPTAVVPAPNSVPAPPGETRAAPPAAVPPVASVPKRKAITPPAPLPEPSFLDEILANPLLLALLAILVAGLGVLGIYSSRKKKQHKDFQDSNMLMNSSLKANSMFGSTGGQSVDTNNSVFNSNFTPSASQLDTNEVDPVAEADVYIAYGRDAQAEEILKEALRTHPERHAVRLKLLEIYASRKDLRGFEVVASELYGMTKGEGVEWPQAANMGIAIDPKNPLYAGGKIPEAGPAKGLAAIAAAHAVDDLNIDDLLNTVPRDKVMPEPRGVIESAGTNSENKFLATDIPVLDEKSGANELQPVTIASNVPPLTPASAPAPAAAAPAAEAGMDFDFDLEGLGIKDLALPTVTRDDSSHVIAMPVAPHAQLETAPDSINFDFLQNAPVSADASQNHLDAGGDLPAEDFAPLEIDFPEETEEPHAVKASLNTPSPLDFDLSGISLDLQAVDSSTPVMPGAQESSGDSQSNIAEMATKLDLALAYHEIGDKEGARELLDEVIKGGSAEQMGKAKSMLQKLS